MDEKQTLHRYLKRQRDGLLGTLDGLGEYDLRRPLVPTGTNLLGLVKHVASVGLEYFTLVFDRPAGRELPWFADGAEPDADLWVPAEESTAQIVELHHHAAARTDETIAALELDAPGVVPWWPPERRNVTLHQTLVHMNVETARHAGHADLVRELIDATAGGTQPVTGRSAAEWAAHRARVEAAARAAGAPA